MTAAQLITAMRLLREVNTERDAAGDVDDLEAAVANGGTVTALQRAAKKE